MNKNFNVSTEQYKVFNVGGKYGIMTWDHKLVFDPKCTKRPNVESLEKYGYTFVQIEEGWNMIDSTGQIYLEHSVAVISWFIQNKIVAFIDNDGKNGLFFITEKLYIFGIDDVIAQKNFLATFFEGKKGLATYSGYEIFKPQYSAVATFDNDIYIAYTDDGKAILNSLSWEMPTEKAEGFKNLHYGILAKFSESHLGWINPKNGKVLTEEQQNDFQRRGIELEKKRTEFIKK